LAVIGGRERAEFPKVYFNCLKGRYQVSVLQNDAEYEESERKDKKEVIYSLKVLSIESVKH